MLLLGYEAFGSLLGLGSRALTNGISALIQEAPESFLLPRPRTHGFSLSSSERGGGVLETVLY